MGRKRAYVGYILIAALLVPLYAVTRDPWWLLLVGPLVAFFGTGYFSGFGAITAELFPTAFRAGAQGLTYNIGRGVSAGAPFLVGRISGERGLGTAFLTTALSFLVAGLVALLLPETRGKQLE
jgi:MFS family permease